MTIKKGRDDEKTLALRLPLKERKNTQDFVISFPKTTAELDVLNDGLGLPQFHAINPAKHPLACTLAEVSYSGAKDGEVHFDLQVKILWQNNGTIPNNVSMRLKEMFSRYFRHEVGGERFEEWTPREFYDNVHVPKKTNASTEQIRHELLQCDLYPFQRRAVRWLLGREGVSWTPQGITNIGKTDDWSVRNLFEQSTDADGHICFVSHALNVATRDLASVESQQVPVRGGILSEEMGLGKTVEIIALICLHRRPMVPPESDAPGPKLSGATLIITPPSILEQWKDEFRNHAPGLKVYHYRGLKGESLDNDDFLDLLADQDVVLTTYNILGREIHFAEEKPQRDFRHKKKFEPRRSPLVQLSWWRVCLDEAQMVESGVSNSAKVAQLIPRVNAWAVSGTPLRKDHKDLYGLLLFLQCTPWSQSPQLWDRLLFLFRPKFKKLIGDIALRHTKDAVREDLQLPPQTRNVISIPFTAIEEQHYQELFQQMCEECGLDENGAPIADDWDPESPSTIEKMRGWLTRLRQTCLHPEVGGRNRRALGRNEGRPLRTVMDVLEVMIEQNDILMRAEQRAVLLSQLRRGQMYENTKSTNEAVALWKDAYDKSTSIAKECRAQLDLEIAKSKEATNNETTSSSSDNEAAEDKDENSRAGVCRSRLRTALEVQHIAIFFMGNAYYQIKTNEEVTKPDTPEFSELEKQEEAAYQEAKIIRGEMLSEILNKANRYMQEVKSKSGAKTFTSLPKMTPPPYQGGIENVKIYEKLEAFCEALNAQAGQFATWKQKMVDFLSHALIDEDEGVELKGDEYEASTKHQDEMYVYMEALRALFADRHDAISGQENFLIAHEMAGNLKAARAGNGPAPELFIKVLAEREKTRPTAKTKELGSLRSIITELRSLITALEWREGQQRQQQLGGNTNARTKAELQIVQSLLASATKMSTEQTKVISTLEREVELFRDTMNIRLEYYRQLQIISDTVAPWEEERLGQPMDWNLFHQKLRDEKRRSEKISRLQSKRRYLIHLREQEESAAAEGAGGGNSEAAVEARMCIICQSGFELGTLTVCGHQFCKECIRLWWRDHHSCPVCKVRLGLGDFHDVTYKPKEVKGVVEEKANGGNGSPGKSSSSSPRSQSQSPEGGSPRSNATTATDTDTDKASSPQAPTPQIYTPLPPSTLNQIKNISLTSSGSSSFGTKVSTITRHILYLRHTDPGSKSLIFSQYRDFLSVLSRAFSAQKIGHTTFDNTSSGAGGSSASSSPSNSSSSTSGIQRFRNDPAIECFLLHAKSNSSGLNLTNASHVFLCEPLVNTAIELQAIARVHRIGQRRETRVWMYIVGETVEESIYRLSVRRRMEHLMRSGRKDKDRDKDRKGKKSASASATGTTTTPAPHPQAMQENAIDAANSIELRDAVMAKLVASGKSGGGEIVGKEDLWRCLFGNGNILGSGERENESGNGARRGRGLPGPGSKDGQREREELGVMVEAAAVRRQMDGERR